jgi:hypothetical protein
MTGGGFFDRHAKELTLVFGGLVTAAGVLAMTLPCESSKTKKRSLGPEKEDVNKRPPGKPETWTDEQLNTFLAERYVYPPDNLDRDGIVCLVETYIKASTQT